MSVTVKELALEARVRELERENYILRNEKGVFDRAIVTPMEALEPVPVAPRVLDLRCLANWSVKFDTILGRPHVVGRSYGKDGSFGYSYFMEKIDRVHQNVKLEILGKLHERVFHELAKYYRL